MYYDIEKSGLRIRELRTAKNLTRQDLAEKIGISENALQKIERGINGAKIDNLIIMTEVFGVSLDYLVCGCEERDGFEGILTGLSEPEKLLVRKTVLAMVKNIELLRN